MTLADSVVAAKHNPCFKVILAGVEIPNPLAIEWDQSFDQQAAACTISIAGYFGASANNYSLVQVYEGYDGQYVNTFTGYIDDVRFQFYPATTKLVCRDVLKRAIDTWLDDVGLTYNTPTQAETVVTALLAEAGLSVTAGTTNFTLADIHPISFKLISVMDAVNQICALIGWRCWATPDGVVHFDVSKPKPAATAVWTYTYGVDILGGEHTDSDRNTRNRIVGLGYNGVRSVIHASSPRVASPPTYRTAIVSSELVDTQGIADTLTAWMLSDLNVATQSIPLKVAGNPLISVGNTIEVDVDPMGLDANFFVFAIHSSNNGETGEYLCTLTVVRQEGDSTNANYEPNPAPPVPDPVPEPPGWTLVFLDEFDGSLSNWSSDAGDGNINVSGGVLTLSLGYGDLYPLVWSNALFNNIRYNDWDYAVEIKFRRSSLAGYGSAFGVGNLEFDTTRYAPGDPTPTNYLENVIHNEQHEPEPGHYGGNANIYLGQARKPIPVDYGWHVMRAEYIGNYQNRTGYHYFDGALVGTGSGSAWPKSLYFGNPVQPAAGAWSNLEIDYVRLYRKT